MARKGGQNSKLGLSTEFFTLHGLVGHVYVPTYQVSSRLDEVYGSGAKITSTFLVILAIFHEFIQEILSLE